VDRPTLSGDAYVALDAFVQHCIDHRRHAVFAGDVFHSPYPPAGAVHAFKQAVDRLAAAGLESRVLLGNHDPTPWYLVVDNVIPIDRTVFHLVGVPCYGLDFRTPLQLQEELPNVPLGTKALFCHQLLDLAFSKEGESNMKAEWVPPYVEHAFIGDFHEEWDQKHGSTHFWYPGSICMQNVRETPDKGFLDVSCRDGRIVKVERPRLPSRRFLQARVNDAEDAARLFVDLDRVLAPENFAGLPEPIRKPMLLVRYATVVPGFHGNLVTAVGDRAHLWPVPDQVVSEPVGNADVPLTSDAALAQLVNPELQSELFAFVKGLLAAPDFRQFLQAKRIELGLEPSQNSSIKNVA
jgi:hypothetical protein